MNAMPEAAAFSGAPGGAGGALGAVAGKSRHPFLEDVFEQAAKRYADEFRRILPSAFFSAAGIDAGLLGDAVEGAEGSAVAAVFRVPEWNAHVVIKMTRPFVLSMTEILFGGDGAEPPYADERPFSALETRVAKNVAQQIARVLEDVFGAAALGPEFKLERVETRLEFALMARRGDQAIAGKFRLKAIGRGGLAFVIIPQAAVDRMLGKPGDAGAAARNADWTQLIGAELRRSEVRLSAILEERRVTLGEVASWRVGQVISLDCGPQSRVRLACNDTMVLSCDLGQAEGAYMLRVAEAVEDQEFMDAIVAR
jgi:flagellar motor switch protein FliM